MQALRPLLAAAAVAALAPAAAAQQTLTLQDAIAVAQRQGLQVQAAQKAVESARWRERGLQARLLPQLSLTGQAYRFSKGTTADPRDDGSTAFYQRQNTASQLGLSLEQVLPLTGGTFFVESGLLRTNSYNLVVGNPTGQRDRYWASTPYSIGYRQQLLRPNVLKWDRREQALQADVAERQFAEAREDVAVSTAEAFLDLYNAQIAVENAAVNAAVNDTLYQLNKGRFEVGKIGENDLLQSELALLRARNSLDAAQLRRDQARASLTRLLNLPPTVEPVVVPPSDVVAVTADPAVAVQQALKHRSQPTQHELQAVQARRRVNAARLTNGIGLTVEAEAGTNQTALGLDAAYQSLLPQRSVSVGVEMPLWQWGAGRAQVQAARADAERVEHATAAERKQFEQEVHFAALQLTQSQRQLAFAAKSDTVADKRFEVAKNRYLIGRIGNSDLYIAQNDRDQARIAYAEALKSYWVSYYRLRRLTLYDFVEQRPLVPRR